MPEPPEGHEISRVFPAGIRLDAWQPGATRGTEVYLARMKGIKEDEAQKTKFVFIPFILFILANYFLFYSSQLPLQGRAIPESIQDSTMVSGK
ncbi:MAG: hypothetical protein KGN80_11885 [Acidobacteriota bacterium]|nr:hypothetical protein [Acidobacteriota bacterium]